jgi:hypothetical protein
MRLTARILENVSGVNSWQYADQASFTEGDAPTIYFQLVDASSDRADQGFVPGGRRYVPASGATLTVLIDHIDDARKLTKVATQPYAGDLSIWSIQLLSSDKLRGTLNLKLTLTESGKVTYGLVQSALGVQSLDGMTRV